MSFLYDLGLGLRLARRLPGFLRQRMDPQTAEKLIARRMSTRGEAFLANLAISLDHPPSPYRWLFEQAGCDLYDAQHLVTTEGLEGALNRLLKAGIYLTVEEFKGRTPIIRGSQKFYSDSSGCRNPGSNYHIQASTSGSRGQPTPILVDLDFLHDSAANTCLTLHLRKPVNWRKAQWKVPGGAAVARLLEFSLFGQPVERWFWKLDPSEAGRLHPRHRLSAAVMRGVSSAVGRRLPGPEFCPVSNPEPVVDWMVRCLNDGDFPNLFTNPSAAVRLAKLALNQGVDLSGGLVTLSGEPLTQTRLDYIEKCGLQAENRYAAMETGCAGLSCLHPDTADQVHLLEDRLALIQPGSLGVVAKEVVHTVPVLETGG